MAYRCRRIRLSPATVIWCGCSRRWRGTRWPPRRGRHNFVGHDSNLVTCRIKRDTIEIVSHEAPACGVARPTTPGLRDPGDVVAPPAISTSATEPIAPSGHDCVGALTKRGFDDSRLARFRVRNRKPTRLLSPEDGSGTLPPALIPGSARSGPMPAHPRPVPYRFVLAQEWFAQMNKSAASAGRD